MANTNSTPLPAAVAALASEVVAPGATAAEEDYRAFNARPERQRTLKRLVQLMGVPPATGNKLLALGQGLLPANDGWWVLTEEANKRACRDAALRLEQTPLFRSALPRPIVGQEAQIFFAGAAYQWMVQANFVAKKAAGGSGARAGASSSAAAPATTTTTTTMTTTTMATAGPPPVVSGPASALVVSASGPPSLLAPAVPATPSGGHGRGVRVDVVVAGTGYRLGVLLYGSAQEMEQEVDMELLRRRCGEWITLHQLPAHRPEDLIFVVTVANPLVHGGAQPIFATDGPTLAAILRLWADSGEDQFDLGMRTRLA